jgi:hypothetical protein
MHAPMIGRRVTTCLWPKEQCKGDCPVHCSEGSTSRKRSRRSRARKDRQQFYNDLRSGMYY